MRCRTSGRCWRCSRTPPSSSRSCRCARNRSDGRGSSSCSPPRAASRPLHLVRRPAHDVPPEEKAEEALAGRGPAILGRPCDVAAVVGVRIGTAPRRDEPVVPGRRGRAAALDRAADVVPADVHRVLRRLVSPVDVVAAVARGHRRDGLAPSPFGCVVRLGGGGPGGRARRGLHGVSRGAGPEPSARQPADVVLSRHRRRRQPRRPERGAPRPRVAPASLGVPVLRRPAARCC